MCKHQEIARLFSILCVKSVKLQITSCTNRATGNWLRQSDLQIMGFDGSDSRNCLHNLSHFNRLLFMQILLEERMPHILHVFFFNDRLLSTSSSSLYSSMCCDVWYRRQQVWWCYSGKCKGSSFNFPKNFSKKRTHVKNMYLKDKARVQLSRFIRHRKKQLK